MLSPDISSKVNALLTDIGLGVINAATQLTGGKNNRVYRVLTTSGAIVAVKLYFYHADDKRDRLGAEYSFISLAWKYGIRSLPRPLALDYANLIGVYEYILGDQISSEDLGSDAVIQALEFLVSLNQPEVLIGSAGLINNASEACFSVAAHLDLVALRLARLAAISPADELDRKALDFVHDSLFPAWNLVRKLVIREANSHGLDLDEELHNAQRMISPCDFGFHNALLTEDGYNFIDFEYSGWDDPARVLADFFNQVAVPLPLSAYSHAKEVIADLLQFSSSQGLRCDLILPVYAIKWIAIVMNDFIPVGSVRRGFASDNPHDLYLRKSRQLSKASRLLSRLDDKLAIVGLK